MVEFLSIIQKLLQIQEFDIHGNTSVGKSKLLNTLFDLQLKTGNGETTKQFQCVYNINDKINIFDSIGYNEQQRDKEKKYRKQLNQINSCHLVFILFNGSLKSLKKLVEIIWKSKQRIYQVAFVYTKCDLIDTSEQTFDQLIQTVRQQLVEPGIKYADQYPFFFAQENPNVMIIMKLLT